jgi:prepilin-type N-terminal cleavage/methylation domain-containing protein
MFKKGFTLVEIIVALGLAALILPALAYVFSFAVTTSSQGGKYSQAYALAQENMEAVYHLKDTWVWTDDTFNTDSGTFYQPSQDGSGNWDLGLEVPSASLATDANGFTEKVQVLPVYRNAGELSSGGTTDPNTRKIISTVIWKINGQEESLSVSSYVTNN